RLRAYAEAFPAPARVSEPALPLLLAALHEELARPLVLLAPGHGRARGAAEAASWFVGEDRVALLPSRGVHWGSGLDPAPHLVGEPARALAGRAAAGRVAAAASRAGGAPVGGARRGRRRGRCPRPPRVRSRFVLRPARRSASNSS